MRGVISVALGLLLVGGCGSDQKTEDDSGTAGRGGRRGGGRGGAGGGGAGTAGEGAGGQGEAGMGAGGQGQAGMGQAGSGEAGSGGGGGGGEAGSGGGGAAGSGGGQAGAGGMGQAGSGGAAAAVPPGAACSCDAECMGSADNPGVCVFGICMTRARAACAMDGSAGECPSGSRCWRLSQEEPANYLCWPDCAGITCAGSCDGDGSCTYTNMTNCSTACGTFCRPGEMICSSSLPNGPCPGGGTCVQGSCISAGCPDWHCTGATCTELVQMPGSYEPTSAEAREAGYFIDTLSRYAYLRRDLTMLLQYAACEVKKKYPDARPIGLGDMSQADGRTPGTDNGNPRHPTTTHTGNDIDLAYYHNDQVNDLQIICGDGTDTNGNGTAGMFNDGYFCTTEQNVVDWPRQLWWWAKLAETPLVRVFGIDQTLDDDFVAGANELYRQGLISNEVRERMTALGYGSDGGWQFHHHHSHNSYRRPATMRVAGDTSLEPLEAHWTTCFLDGRHCD